MRITGICATLAGVLTLTHGAGAEGILPDPSLAPIKVTATVDAAASSLRPKVRPVDANPDLHPAVFGVEDGFILWLDGFKDRARVAGIGERTLQEAFNGISPDPEVIKRDRNQSEFTKTIWQYLASAASDTRIANGKSALAAHAQTLDAIEARYGVEKEVVVAVWGLESAYGTYRGSNDVVRSLATLAHEGRRGAFFEEQLISALKILQNGDIPARSMTGSWAGAMGHTQFIPTSYLANAVDFDGDGRRDIWSRWRPRPHIFGNPAGPRASPGASRSACLKALTTRLRTARQPRRPRTGRVSMWSAVTGASCRITGPPRSCFRRARKVLPS